MGFSSGFLWAFFVRQVVPFITVCCAFGLITDLALTERFHCDNGLVVFMDRFMWRRRLRKSAVFTVLLFVTAWTVGAWYLGQYIPSTMVTTVGGCCLAVTWALFVKVARLSWRVDALQEAFRLDEGKLRTRRAEDALAEKVYSAIRWDNPVIRQSRITRGMTIEEIREVLRKRERERHRMTLGEIEEVLRERHPDPMVGVLEYDAWNRRGGTTWERGNGIVWRAFNAHFDAAIGQFWLEFEDGKLVSWDGPGRLYKKSR